MAILAGIWLIFLARGLDSILIPPLAALALIYLLIPVHNQSWASRTMLAAGILGMIWLMSKVMAIVWIAFLGLFMAYVLNPPVTWLERKGIPRTRGALYLLLPFLAVLFYGGYMMIPKMYSQGVSFVNQFPEYVTTLTERYRSSLHSSGLDDFPIDIAGLISTVGEALKKMASGAGQGILGWVKKIGTVLTIALLTPVVGYNLLRDFPMIQKNALRIVPRRYEGEIIDLFQEMDVLIGRWLRGQLTVSVISGTLTGGALAVVGLPYAVLLGVVTGVLNLVPIVGYWVSLILALIVALSTGDPFGMSLWVLGIYLTIQLLEQNFYAPRIMGNQTGLHPVAVLLSLLIFGSLLGFAGALLAIPFTLFLRVFYRRYLRRQLRNAGSSATLVTPPGA
jgi:predicted PurR-regulated permease PerM